MTSLPYGSWPSPITAASLTEAGRSLTFLRADADRLYWVEGRPSEGGRGALMMQRAGADPVEVTGPGANVRSRVYEYGGHPYDVRDGLVIYSDFATQRLHRLDTATGEDRPITPDLGGPLLRWAGHRIDPTGRYLLAVQEDHRGDGECTDTIVRLDLDEDRADGGIVLVGGTDFVSAPRPNPDWTRLAWVTWDHPNMPWDVTTLWVADLDPDGNLTGPRALATGCSWSDPHWLPDGRLSVLGEPTGWNNLYAVDPDARNPRPEPLWPAEIEFGGPTWQVDMAFHAALPDGRVAATRIERGQSRVAVLDPGRGTQTPLDERIVAAGDLTVVGDEIALIAGFRDAPVALLRVDTTTAEHQVVRRAGDTVLPPEVVSESEPVEWTSQDGATAYGHLYPPRNGELTGPEGERPPLLMFCHGGPTSMTFGAYTPSIFYWTSRGYAVLDLNYAGSSGFGKAYRDRLAGRWGVADVADAATGARAMADQGRVDGARLAIRGGSAGGYLTLAALAFSDAFTAGASYFGIGDLETLARDTHKFESRYPDGLIGPYPQEAQTYRDRSPVHHVDRLSAPMILLQGLDDEVVPPNQAYDMEAAVRVKGLPVGLLTFEGEGHGFRRAENNIAAVRAEEYFYGRVFGFDPAEDLPPIDIANLPEKA